VIRIDGKEVEAAGTVLDACKRAGADVPAFCHHDRLGARGRCRSCIVEIGGRYEPACTTSAADGMSVVTESDTLAAYRRDLGELFLAEAAPRGSVLPVIQQLGSHGGAYPRRIYARAPHRHHPYIEVDPAACIHCGLCVDACATIQGAFVYAFEHRGRRTSLGFGPEGLLEAGCVSCGACVEVCPTEAITDVDRARAAPAERIVRTTCGYCGVGCSLDVHVADGAIQYVSGAESPVNRAHLCVKGRYAHRFVRHPDRLRTPLVRKNGALEPASWDEALDLVARELRRLAGRTGALSSARCTNEENYLLQKWFRAGLGVNDVDCCARVCHAPSAKGLGIAFGMGAATNGSADIDLADLFLVAGSNTTEAHPIVGARVVARVLSGGARLIVIDPRATELARLADVHLAPRPGTNVALFNSIARVLFAEELVDRSFIAARTEGAAELESFLASFGPESTESITGVPARDVRRAARLYGTAARPMQLHGLGVTEHYQGSEAVMLLANLAMLVGAVGRPGTGVNPLRGQNNVQGAADMGCQPNALTGYADPRDPIARARFESVWGRPIPIAPGRTVPKMYDAIREGHLRGLFIMGEDVVHTDPDASSVRSALASLELLVVQEIFLSETAKLAHVVLPGASFLEKEGTFTNGERRIQRVRPVIDPIEGSRPDWQILLDLMERTGYPQAARSPAAIMDEVARVAPMFAGVSYDRLGDEGLAWPVPSADHPGTPILHRDEFTRGKGLLSRVEYVPSPSLASGAGPLSLVTGRSLVHYNSGSMTRRTDNLLLEPEDALELHPNDAATREIVDGARVRIESSHGTAWATARLTERVPPGTVFLTFHHPETETNRLTTDVLDRLADTPEYKLTRVEVTRADRGQRPTG
jgi:formate dehydrogenase major subunit